MDRHPKRRKSKDNPYILEANDNKYIIKFKDTRNNLCELAISENLYQTFNRFELEDISQLHKYERHIEHSLIYEEQLYNRSFKKPIDLETFIIDKILIEKINDIINYSLSKTQQLRLKLYFFENRTLDDIAKIEGTTHQAISKSIKNSLEKIKKLVKI